MLEEIDMAVREQGVSRTHFLRQAVERNLRHYQNFERAIFARIYQERMSWDSNDNGRARLCRERNFVVMRLSTRFKL